MNVFAKEHYKQQVDSVPSGYQPAPKDVREQHKLSKSEFPLSTLEVLLIQLQQRLRVMFGGPQEAFRFFDISGQGKCSKAHFSFCCSFCNVHPIHFLEIIELFGILDVKNDGVLDY